ncbi:hypothetical protein ACLKA7_001813 [Drosophila subpalustris]
MAKRTGLQISAAGTTETAQLVMFVPTSVVSVLQFEALSFRKIRSDSRNTTAHFEACLSYEEEALALWHLRLAAKHSRLMLAISTLHQTTGRCLLPPLRAFSMDASHAAVICSAMASAELFASP